MTIKVIQTWDHYMKSIGFSNFIYIYTYIRALVDTTTNRFS